MSLLVTLLTALEVRDPYLRGHSARVAQLAEGLARGLGWRERRIEGLRLGGSLHDVGKITIDREILRKPGPLSPEEFTQIRLHPLAGAQLVTGIKHFRPALPYVLYHHERWDGAGYPEGRVGKAIPVEARILAVADAFDAMTSLRSYRPTLPVPSALEELERCAGSQFDPQLAERFVSMWRPYVATELVPAVAI